MSSFLSVFRFCEFPFSKFQRIAWVVPCHCFTCDSVREMVLNMSGKALEHVAPPLHMVSRGEQTGSHCCDHQQVGHP